MKKQLMPVIAVALAVLLTAPAVFAQGSNDGQRLRSEIQKTNEVIVRAKEAVSESGSQRARDYLTVAIKFQGLSVELADRPTMWSRAMKYTLDARDQAQKAVAVTRQAVENDDYVRRRLERTDDLLHRVEERVGPESPANILLLLDSAREKQNRAIEFFRNGRLKVALQMTLQVEKSIENMIGRLGGQADARNRYEMALNRYFALRERFEQEGFGAGEQAAFYEQAAQLRQQAERRASENDYVKAEKMMQKANQLMSRTAEQLRQPDNIRAALEEMTRTMEMLREKIEATDNRPAGKLYENAERHMERARKLFRQEKMEAATIQLQAARRLMSQISGMLEE